MVFFLLVSTDLSDTLDLDAEDLSQIYRMVSDWDPASLHEAMDGGEVARFMQDHHLLPDVNPPESSQHPQELHDRLPSYYTALAPCRSSPWIPQAAQQVFNKLPAYITDQLPPASPGGKQNPKGENWSMTKSVHCL